MITSTSQTATAVVSASGERAGRETSDFAPNSSERDGERGHAHVLGVGRGEDEKGERERRGAEELYPD